MASWGRAGSVTRAFRINVADEVLDDLRARLRRTKWPDRIPGIGWAQGTERDWLQGLVSYWADAFDWRAWERRLNALEHFIWQDIHFVRRRAAAGRGMPLILTHGWPGSFLDYLDVLPLLDDFDVIVPSLPGYGFSARPPRVGINYRRVAARWHGLMTALGHERYGVGGGDFGAGVSTFLALDHPQAVIGLHLTTIEIVPQPDEAALSPAERAYLSANRAWAASERGYSALQSTKPQTLGYALNDSPAGLAGYLGEKWRSWSDSCPADDFSARPSPFTGSRRPSPRRCGITGTIAGIRSPTGFVGTPTAFGIFANETVPEGKPPRSYMERLYDVRRWTVFPQGGHFAPVEQPAALAADLTAFFRGLER